MSASNKKKLRKEEHEAKLTERQLAEQNEAKKLKISTNVFVVAISLILVIGVVMMGYNWFASTGLRERWTTAAEIGGQKLTVAELNYYYIDMMNELSQDWYSMYLLTLEEGLDSSKSLDDQLYHGEEGRTWGDYFVDKAIEEAAGVLALCDAANRDGFTLTEDQKTEIEDTMLAMETQGMLYGFGNVTDFLQAIYGNGAEMTTYKTYVENLTLAQAYYNDYTEKLSYDAAAIEAQEKEEGSYSSFTYTYYHLDPEDFITHEDTEAEEHTHSDEELKAALEQAKALAEELAASGATNKEELDKAIAALDIYKTEEAESTEETEVTETTESTEPAATTEATEATEPAETTASTEPAETTETTEPTEVDDPTEEIPVTSTAPKSTTHTDYAYSSINTAIAEWLISAEHEEGDIAAIPYYAMDEEGNKTETIESYYVVIFGSEDKHDENMVSVRHILISYTGGTTDEDSGETVYTDEEKKAAEDKILEIKAEWEAGAKTEDTFAELAKKYTNDSNGDEGGLYDEVYPGWAVEEFDAWCFDENRKPGDVDVVSTEYGCHLIYFVQENEETYREYMITTDLRAKDSEEWYTGLRDAYKNVAIIGDTSLIKTDIILANS